MPKEEPGEFTKKIADQISNAVNSFHGEGVGELLAKRIHPTLQQNFMRIAIEFISYQAQKEYFDGRNEATVNACKILQKIIEQQPDDFVFPFI